MRISGVISMTVVRIASEILKDQPNSGTETGSCLERVCMLFLSFDTVSINF